MTNARRLNRWGVLLLGAAVGTGLAVEVASAQVSLPFPKRSSRSKSEQQEAKQPTSNTTGMVRRMDADWLILEADDHRIMSFRIGTKTVLQKERRDAKLNEFRPGDHVTVDANQNDEGQLFATTVTFDKAGTAAEYTHATQPMDDTPIPVRRADRSGGVTGSGDPDDERPRLTRGGAKKPASSASDDDDDDKPVARKAAPPPRPGTPASSEADNAAADPDSNRTMTTVQDASDNGRPRVRRGMPAPKPRSASDDDDAAPPPPTQVAKVTPPSAPAMRDGRPVDDDNAPAPATTGAHPRVESGVADRNRPGGDPFIEQTRVAVAHFTDSLPAYQVQQFTTRFQSSTPKASWQAQDVVAADVVYQNGHEKYRNIKVNNRESKKSMEELGGSWSTGEFASTISDVFSPYTQADFRFRRTETIVNRKARVFEYKVARENSHWTVLTTSQSYKPGYKGKVWIDEETHLVLRLEMEAYGLPEDFPMDHVEMTLDYDFVRLNGPSFLLPVESNNLSCQRGTPYCSKNTTEFRNYKKYGSESTITFTQE